ncbi:hypothetical protein GF345_06050 [Candidatus Woesearchaeota archaeon]|nr:hypothetical protein [Candidatus Woesearchaeota archaeon]
MRRYEILTESDAVYEIKETGYIHHEYVIRKIAPKAKAFKEWRKVKMFTFDEKVLKKHMLDVRSGKKKEDDRYFRRGDIEDRGKALKFPEKGCYILFEGGWTMPVREIDEARKVA